MNPELILATRFLLFNQVVLIRRKAFEMVGGYNPKMRLLEDHDLAFRLALLGPWAFVEDPLVTKHNNTNGIGVLAMLDPMVHSRAWRGVLEGMLMEAAGNDSKVGPLLRRSLVEVQAEIRLAGSLRDSGTRGRLVARMRMFFLHKRQALRRRMPGWPRVHALETLPANVASSDVFAVDVVMPFRVQHDRALE